MPLVHVYEEYLIHGFATGEAWSQGLILMYLCMFGPSVFMISLGMNIVFSSHNSPMELAQRGIRTLVLFYGLNIFRYVIPGSIAVLCGDAEAKYSVLRQFLCSDILFFAGVTFLFFALMKKISAKPHHILLISLMMLTLDTLIPEPQPESEFVAIALGKFLYVNGWSCFPVLSWIIYPAIGYNIGLILLRSKSEDERRSFWRNILLISFVGLLSVCACMRSYGLDALLIAASPVNNYITDLFNVVLDLFLAGLMYCLYYYLHLPILGTKAIRGISRISSGILIFYCIHWVIVGWLEYTLLAMGMREQHTFGFGSIMLTGLAIIVISLALTLLVQNYLKRSKTKG